MQRNKIFIFLLIPLLTSCIFELPFLTTTSKTTTSSTEPETMDIKKIPVNITAINDFHGIIDGRNYSEVGLEKMASYLRKAKNDGDILLNSGDTYQGSLLSYHDRGESISRTMRDIGFDAITIGNHDFDWGIDSLKNNEKAFGTTFLGANIYNYPDVETKSSIGDLYKIKTLYEGTKYEVKVGIIGVIGQSQFSSITSLNTKDIIFKDETEVIKSLSSKLRYEMDCDVILASCHTPELDNSLYKEDSKGNNIIDAAFLGHDHENYSNKINGIPFSKAGAYGEAISKTELLFNKNTGSVTCKSVQTIDLGTIALDKDSKTGQFLSVTRENVNDYGYKTIGKNNTDGGTGTIARYYAKLAAEKAVDMKLNIDVVVLNYARSSLKKNNFTYSDLFETHPFINGLWVMSVLGSELKTEINYNYCYSSNGLSYSTINKSKRYTILTYDYLGFHQTINRDLTKSYNYFPSAFVDADFEPYQLLENNEKIDVFNLALTHLQENGSIENSDVSGSNFLS